MNACTLLLLFFTLWSVGPQSSVETEAKLEIRMASTTVKLGDRLMIDLALSNTSKKAYYITTEPNRSLTIWAHECLEHYYVQIKTPGEAKFRGPRHNLVADCFGNNPGESALLERKAIRLLLPGETHRAQFTSGTWQELIRAVTGSVGRLGRWQVRIYYVYEGVSGKFSGPWFEKSAISNVLDVEILD